MLSAAHHPGIMQEAKPCLNPHVLTAGSDCLGVPSPVAPNVQDEVPTQSDRDCESRMECRQKEARFSGMPLAVVKAGPG